MGVASLELCCVYSKAEQMDTGLLLLEAQVLSYWRRDVWTRGERRRSVVWKELEV